MFGNGEYLKSDSSDMGGNMGDIMRDLATYGFVVGVKQFGIALEADNQCPEPCMIIPVDGAWSVRVK